MQARTGAVLTMLAALNACAPGAMSPKTAAAPDTPADAQHTDAHENDALAAGHRLMEAGEYEKAIKAFHRAALADGMSADVLAGLGSAHLQLGRLDTAERLLRRAVEKAPERPQIWNNLGVVLMEKRAWAEARQMFRRAYALDSGRSDAIRDNLRLALAKITETGYNHAQEQNDKNYKLVRRGSSDYLLRKIPQQ